MYYLINKERQVLGKCFDKKKIYSTILSVFNEIAEDKIRQCVDWSVVDESGYWYIKKDKKGRMNYDIIKSSTSTNTDDTKGEEVALSLDEARLNRVEVIYVDQTTQQYTKFHLNKAVASGDFSASKFSLSSFADIHFHFFPV